MDIRISRLRRTALEEIIRKLGPLSIGRCKSYIDNKVLFFDVSLVGSYRISSDDLTVTFDHDNKNVTISRYDFLNIIML